MNMAESVSLKVLTFNAWGLPITIPSQRKRRRLNRLPGALAAHDADVIVLQELFDVRARRRLLRELCPPYVTTDDAANVRRIMGLVPADTTGGLLVLSRYPIVDSRFIQHQLGPGTKPDERLGRKGAMLVRLALPLGPLTVFAIHLYAGTKSKDSGIRQAQLSRLLEELAAQAGDEPVLLAGDINVSPTAGFPERPGPNNPPSPEYALLTGAGFIDPQPPNPTPVERCVTWVPSRNPYAALPYQETKTDERYDYVMVRPGAAQAWRIGQVRTILDAKDTLLSDHFGVLAELNLVGRGARRNTNMESL